MFWICFMLIFAGIALVIIIEGHFNKCPKCEKTDAMEVVSDKCVKSYDTTKDVEHEIKNNKREVIGTYTQTVPATAYVHRVKKKCKYCGYEEEYEYTNVN